ncbi:MAG: malectin domain-containing carbohydrate-binding protein [Capsulimonadaceae bacterium]
MQAFRSTQGQPLIGSLLDALFLLLMLVVPAPAQISVLTQHNDNFRTGSNTQEAILTTSNVNESSFGKLFTVNLDAGVNGQVLYVPGLTIKGVVHNVIYAYTSGNSNNSPSSVWAFDADNGGQLWQHSFSAGSAEWTTCAPVIDPSTDTIYVLTKDTTDTGNTNLRALDITTGIEKPGSPILVQASVPGTGDGSAGGVVTFNTAQENDRPGLVFVNGDVYIAFAHNTDSFPYHGWVMGYHYDGTAFTQTAEFCTTPNGGLGGVWQAGQGIAADSSGYIYVGTGNGTFDVNTGGIDYGMSYVKLATPGLTVADYFSPFDELSWSSEDADLAGGGIAGIAGTDRFFAGASKFGSVFLVDTSNMGEYNPTTDAVLQRLDNVTQQFSVGQNPATWDTGTVKYVYLWPSGNNLMQFYYDPSVGMLNPAGVYKQAGPDQDGGALAVSANGGANGILWAQGWDGVLYAFNAVDVSMADLWDSGQNASRDGIPGSPHFSFPTVVNGKVYAPAGNTIAVFGLLPAAVPVGLAASAGNGSVSLTWTASVNATTYCIFRGTASGSTPATPMATGIASTAYVDTAVNNGTTYFYTVAAVDAAGTSAPSAVAAAAPSTALAAEVAIDAGGVAAGNYVADTDDSGGSVGSVSTNPIVTTGIVNAAPQSVYQTQRYGNLTYTIPGLLAGAAYTVRLHFAEVYFSTAGSRTFDVAINGTQVLTDFDILATAGGEYIATVQQFKATDSGAGTIQIAFTSVVNNAQVNGIEVIPPGPSGSDHVLWRSSSGALSLWNYNPSTGGYTQNTFGPYPGWTPVAVADGPDGGTRVLWSNAAGAASVWNVNGIDGDFTQTTYGPFAGWSARAVSVAPGNNVTHILWVTSGGAASLWNDSSSTGAYTQNSYGPFAGWTATAVADGPDGMTRVAWVNSGAASIWSLNSAAGTFTQNSFGPYKNWTVTGVSVNAANATHVLWTSTGGAASLWALNTATGAYTQNAYGPYSGWNAVAIADGSDGNAQVLWNGAAAGTSIWDLNNGDGLFSQFTYGQFSGWTAAAISGYP